MCSEGVERMRILVDADASSRVKLVERVARQYKVPVTLFCDDSRLLESSYAEIVYCAIHRDSADMTLLNHCKKGDIVVSSDLGLAGIALAKGASVIHGSGEILDNRKIDMALYYRAMKQKIRRNTKHTSQSRKVNFGDHPRGQFDFYGNLVYLIKVAGKE